MIQLSNFSSLFELLAGINLAFIAVNYLNDYSNILAQKVFQIEVFIKDNFDNVLEKINGLRNSVLGLDFNDEKCAHTASKLARDGENHIASLEERSKVVTDEALGKCYFKTFSSTCLWSFLFCCFVLFASGYESINRSYINDLNIQKTILFFSLFSYIFFILCWGYGDTKKKLLNKIINKLSYVLIACSVSFLLSIIIAVSTDLHVMCNNYFIYLILLPILAPCINFIISICPTFYRISVIKRDTRTYISAFQLRELVEYEKDVEAILRAKKWNFDTTDTNIFEFEIRGIRHIGAVLARNNRAH